MVTRQLLFLLSGVLAVTCVRDEHLDRCIQLAQPLLSENHLVVPSTRPELQLVCDKWRVFVECINKYVTSHYTSGQKSRFNGAVESAVRNVYKMCNDNQYSSEYLLHAPCIKQMTMQRDRCGEYYTNMARVVTEGMGSDEEVCCLHRKFRACMASQSGCALSRPDSSVHEFVDTFLNNGLHVFDQKCHNYAFSSGHCAGSTPRDNRLHQARLSPDTTTNLQQPPQSAHQSAPQSPPYQSGHETRANKLPAEHRAAAQLPLPTAAAAGRRQDSASGDQLLAHQPHHPHQQQQHQHQHQHQQQQQQEEEEEERGGEQQQATAAYQGWFRPETTTSVWLASNSLDNNRAQAQRQQSPATAPLAPSILATLTLVALVTVRARCW